MKEKIYIFLAALVLLLAGIACATLYEFNCAAKGGVWLEGDWNGDLFIAAHCDEGDNTPQSNDDSGNSQGVETRNNDAPDPQPESSQHAPVEMAEPEECLASDALQLTVSVPEVKDTSNETRCSYTITYTNTGGQQIWVFLQKRYKGAYTEVEDTWQNYISLDPGESVEMQYDTHMDKQSGNTWIDVIIGVAPIYATDACKNTFRDDTAPRAQIGYPVEVPCE